MPAGNGFGPSDMPRGLRARKRPETGLYLYATATSRSRPLANLKLSKEAMRSLSDADVGVRLSYDYDGDRIVIYAHPLGRYSLAPDGSAKFTLADPEFTRWFPHRPDRPTQEALRSLAQLTYIYSDVEVTSWRPIGNTSTVTALRFNPAEPSFADDPRYDRTDRRLDPPDVPDAAADIDAGRNHPTVSANGPA